MKEISNLKQNFISFVSSGYVGGCFPVSSAIPERFTAAGILLAAAPFKRPHYFAPIFSRLVVAELSARLL